MKLILIPVTSLLLWLIPFSLVLYTGYIYNRIIRRKNAVMAAQGSVDAMLKKRSDLLPNLVEITRQHALTESAILQKLLENNPLPGNDMVLTERFGRWQLLGRQIQLTLAGLNGIPALGTNKAFLQLQAAWNESEEQIAAARRFYNTAVMEYNNAIEVFPSNLLVDPARFKPMLLPEITEEELKAPSFFDLVRK
jgi:LemA protein